MDLHSYLRVIFPSFCFFNHVAAAPQLLVRWNDSEWINVLAPPPLPWYGLFINPRWTLHHAQCNLLQRLLEETSTLNIGIEELESFRRIRSLVRRFVIENSKSNSPTTYHFRVVANKEDALISPEERI